MSVSPIIALFPEASFGAALNCVGIAQELQRLGATPVFICHPGFTGVFAEYGFKEYHLYEATPSSAHEAEDYWQSFISNQLAHFDLDPEAQLPTYVGPTWEAIVDTVEAAEEGLEALLTRIKPDAILLDNVIMFPAIIRAGCPWVRVVSCAETELPDANVPPYLSGLDPKDRLACKRFEKSYLKATDSAHRRYNTFRKARGLAPLPAGNFLETSEHLNLILAPTAVRYDRHIPLAEPEFVFLEGCVRSETRFDSPHFPVEDGPLIYMSFGSLGAIDTQLIERMIDVFAKLPARFLINVGGFLEAYQRVPDNVFLGSWFPQPSVVAQSALFIHHGGNNSYCEALYHGVPSLIMPYCWDGHDNAQRAQATGTGLNMHRSNWTDGELESAVLSLLHDVEMQRRLKGISEAMKAVPGTSRAAMAVLDCIESNMVAD
ncbi:glycosyltransferase [Hoeflea sp. AS60]|uniref:glycosyltransferase n=1 Tax=Hoeflea sp. AS60 TaxID=3135780 RepID=UPI003173A2FC